MQFGAGEYKQYINSTTLCSPFYKHVTHNLKPPARRLGEARALMRRVLDGSSYRTGDVLVADCVRVEKVLSRVEVMLWGEVAGVEVANVLCEEFDVLGEVSAVVDVLCKDVDVLEEVIAAEVVEGLSSKVNVCVVVACTEFSVHFLFALVNSGYVYCDCLGSFNAITIAVKKEPASEDKLAHMAARGSADEVALAPTPRFMLTVAVTVRVLAGTG